MMKRLRFLIEPNNTFGSPILGVTFFGQMCWGVRENYSESKLTELLTGYTDGKPFAVASDAFPTGFLPMPVLPRRYLNSGEISAAERKEIKKKHWLTREALNQSSQSWLNSALSDEAAGLRAALTSQAHNTINRDTLTTGEGQFAPFQTNVYFYDSGIKLDLYIDFDEDRISQEEIETIVGYVGFSGYGRDASTGLGHYSVKSVAAEGPEPVQTNFYLTLADCAPSLSGCNPKDSFYQTRVHFGRVGAQRAVQGSPFKRPVVMAKTGAVLSIGSNTQYYSFIGQGLSDVCPQYPDVVTQGYAPVIPLPKCEIV